MNRRFRFWFITLATALGAGVTVSLGCWQYSRGLTMQAQDVALAQQARLASLDALQLMTLMLQPDQALHRHARLSGHWLSQRSVFLDNRPMHGKAGLVLLSPFQMSPGGGWIMVQRGWVQRNFLQRDALPAVPDATGLVEIEGRIAPWPSKLYDIAGSGEGLIRQNLDWAQFRAESGLPLLALTLKQTGSASDGLLRDWPETEVALRKHFGYALQWWGISALLVILYVWFQIVRRFFHRNGQ